MNSISSNPYSKSKECDTEYQIGFDEHDNSNGIPGDDIQNDRENAYDSFSERAKQKRTKRHDKHHQFDDSEPLEEQHYKKRDSGKRRHHVKNKDLNPSDELQED